ncbi:unnamed protein product [Citrullus colocynthis]|uniref:Uncharacterized protein n=1 Tax=Citrullus colocynthis TaxID=252529 RepID=A0ABP0YNI7_9ROSI
MSLSFAISCTPSSVTRQPPVRHVAVVHSGFEVLRELWLLSNGFMRSQANFNISFD